MRILGRLLSHLSLHEGDEGATLFGRHSDASDLAKNLAVAVGCAASASARPEKKAGKWETIIGSKMVRSLLDR